MVASYPVSTLEQASLWFGLCWSLLQEDEATRDMIESTDANGNVTYTEPTGPFLFDEFPNLKKFAYYNLSRLREFREFVGDFVPLVYDDVVAFRDSIDETQPDTNTTYWDGVEADYQQLKTDNLVLGELFSMNWSYEPYRIDRNSVIGYADLDYLDTYFPAMFVAVAQ